MARQTLLISFPRCCMREEDSGRTAEGSRNRLPAYEIDEGWGYGHLIIEFGYNSGRVGDVERVIVTTFTCFSSSLSTSFIPYFLNFFLLFFFFCLAFLLFLLFLFSFFLSFLCQNALKSTKNAPDNSSIVCFYHWLSCVIINSKDWNMDYYYHHCYHYYYYHHHHHHSLPLLSGNSSSLSYLLHSVPQSLSPSTILLLLLLLLQCLHSLWPVNPADIIDLLLLMLPASLVLVVVFTRCNFP